MDVQNTPDVALFRLEGTLSPRPTLTAATWLALNAQRMRTRFLGLSTLALSAPLSFGPMRDPGRASKLSWSVLEGMSEDRLIVLGQIYAEEHLIGSLSEIGMGLLKTCQQQKQRIILLSDSLDVIVNPIAEHLGIAEVFCNKMEYHQGHATGELISPVLGSELGGRLLHHSLEERGVVLSEASGYGSLNGDSLLLGAVGRPCAVSPQRGLRRIARDLDWPVVEGEAQ